jgi:hypothetical protein
VLLGLGSQTGLPRGALAGSLVAGHGRRPYPIPETASHHPGVGPGAVGAWLGAGGQSNAPRVRRPAHPGMERLCSL